MFTYIYYRLSTARKVINRVRSKKVFMSDEQRIQLLAEGLAALEGAVRDLTIQSTADDALRERIIALETEVPYETN